MKNSVSRPRIWHQKSYVVGVAVLAIALLVSGAEESLPTGDRSLNVLVITLDTIRTDRLGAYGNPRIRTEFVDGLADRGVVFDRCVATTPLTLPSHTSLFTGTYPVLHGVRDNGNYVVPAELETMAELFRNAGYRTGGFVGAFVLSSRWGLDQGFETYTEPTKGYDPSRVSLSEVERRADEVVDDAIGWLRKKSEKPFLPGSTSTIPTCRTILRRPLPASTRVTPISARWRLPTHSLSACRLFSSRPGWARAPSSSLPEIMVRALVTTESSTMVCCSTRPQRACL